MPQVLKNKRFIVLASIILFLIIGSFCFWNFNLKDSKVDAAGESWMTGWTYRKPITVTNNTPACTVSSGLTCTTTTSGGYVINTFTGSGTWTVPSGVTSVDYLVVAGGGGGGGRMGGGGGAGGLLSGTNYSITSGASISITIGAGGAGGGASGTVGSNGGNSIFNTTITAIGGGGGGSSGNVGVGYAATSGGSGGGGAGGQSMVGASGTSGQGNSGANGYASLNYGGAGGGGASAAGGAGTASAGGNGGAGTASSITGSSITYAGGGGGGLYSSGTPGFGGGGGGGNGSVTGAGSAGTNGLGGGGGGGAHTGTTYAGGAGGSGTVIVRYLAPTLTNYQTKITVPYVSGMKADFSDLRFTSSDGTTELSYWIESYTASTSAVVWVKVPSLVSGSNTIYMYYGNSSATTTSSGDNTFVFFDDFSGTSFNSTKWDTLNSPTVSGGYAAFRSTSAWQAALSKYTASDTRNYQIYVRYRIVNTSEQRLFHGWSNVTAPSSNYPACSYMYGYNRLYATYGGTAYVSFAFALGTWYTAKHNLNSSYYQTVTLVENGSATVTATTAYSSTINKVFLGTVYGGGDVDWVFVKSYAPTEPTVTIGGEENLVLGCGTGGIVTKVDGYCIHKFTTVGTTTWTVPTGVASVDYLVVGGGGSGGTDVNTGGGNGGGGAGGFLTGTLSIPAGTSSYSVTVGAGGAARTAQSLVGFAGGNSIFGSMIAVGGGGGGGYPSRAGNPTTGGSGGGAGMEGTGANGTSGQGNAGGSGSGRACGAGGGGAGAIGVSPTADTIAGNGGIGLSSLITGSVLYYAGGGGGGAYGASGTAGSGGNGGGGAGGITNGAGVNGEANTGGGGGGSGANNFTSGAGGSGIVIVRYLSDDAVLAEITPVSSPTTDTTPNYTFSSTKAGTITYGGGCSSSTTSAIAGNNTITFSTLTAGAHSCTIAVGGSNVLTTTFTVVSLATYTSPNLSCTLTNGTCTETNEAIIFKLYDPAGNHAELSTQSNYPYKVCCTGIGISNSCSGNYDTVLKLSAVTNAHAEKKTLSNYTNNVCLSSSAMGVTCGYSANTSCSDLGTNYVCLASVSGDTNAHAGECSTYATKVCCSVAVLVDPCTAKVTANKFISAKDTDIQLCSGADTSNPSDPCYSVCWKGTGTPDVTSSDWKCGVCHNSSNVPVSCSTLGSTFAWSVPTGYTTPANYTLIGTSTLTSANPIINFTAQDANRQMGLSINNYGVTCSSSSTVKLMPTWKEISPFK